jgi:hypothetical protein
MAWVPILWSGFVATTLASALFWVGRSVGLTTFSPTIQLGCLLTRDPRRPVTDTVGFVLLFLAGSTIAPALFKVLLAGWSGPAWIGGLVVGGFIGVAGAAALPLFGMISACVKTGMIPPPGPFGIGWGRPTPGVIFAGLMLYGAVVAAILAGF